MFIRLATGWLQIKVKIVESMFFKYNFNKKSYSNDVKTKSEIDIRLKDALNIQITSVIQALVNQPDLHIYVWVGSVVKCLGL